MLGISALRQVFSMYFGFPCHSFTPQSVPKSSSLSSSVIQGWYTRPLNGSSNCGLESTPASKIKEFEIWTLECKVTKYDQTHSLLLLLFVSSYLYAK
jgi:hypothetical protein